MQKIRWSQKRIQLLPDEDFIEECIRGLQSNREELNFLLYLFISRVVCLQEIFVNVNRPPKFNSYSYYSIPAEETITISVMVELQSLLKVANPT